MARTRWLLAVVLTLIMVADIVLADVVFNYNGQVGIKPTSSPITMVPGQCPCGCSSWSQTINGFTTTITGYTLSTTSGYVLTTPLAQFNTATGGTLMMTLSPNTAMVSDYVNGTMIYPTPGSFSLGAGNYLLIQNLTLGIPVNGTITLSGQYNYTVGGVTFQYSFSETINPPSADVMNLLNGLQAFYVPHVYQGDNNGNPTKQWPVYYGPSTASQYWSPISTSINQPMLELTPALADVGGAMFWSETYSGGSVTITLVGTFSSGTLNPADGFVIYLFLEPSGWSISSTSNYTIKYISAAKKGWVSKGYPSPVEGDVIYPQSSTPYIMVQWDPYWQVGHSGGSGGQWNVWVLSNLDSDADDPKIIASWNGIGTGYFRPNPGNYMCITVTYNPSTNTLSGVAYDINTGQSASFTQGLGNSFKAPPSGTYAFGVGAATGTEGAYANWGIVYVNYQG